MSKIFDVGGGNQGAGRSPLSGPSGRPPLGQAEDGGVLADFGGFFWARSGSVFQSERCVNSSLTYRETNGKDLG